MIDRTDSTPLPTTCPELPYQMAANTRTWVHVGNLVSENPDEPALEVRLFSLPHRPNSTNITYIFLVLPPQPQRSLL